MRIRYSSTKPERPGRPIEASITTVKSAASTGAGPWRPVKSAIWMLARRRSTKPMMRKKPMVMTPWLNINSTAPTTRDWSSPT